MCALQGVEPFPCQGGMSLSYYQCANNAIFRKLSYTVSESLASAHCTCSRPAQSYAHTFMQGQCGYGTSIDVLAKQRREEWDIGANIGRIATSLSSRSVGMDGHGNSSEQYASQQSQHSAWFSGQALKPFIDREARQAEVEEANRYTVITFVAKAAQHAQHELHSLYPNLLYAHPSGLLILLSNFQTNGNHNASMA